MQSVDLPDGLTSINSAVFARCTSLKTINIPDSVTLIGDYAFSGDVYNVCLDDAMAYAAVSEEGTYIYTYHINTLYVFLELTLFG